MCRQKQLNADSKVIQQTELVEPLKNPDGVVVSNEFMFVLTILEKSKETRLTFSCGNVLVS